MKHRFSSVLIPTFCVLAASAPFALADEKQGLYFNADLGGAVAETTALNEFPDAPPGGKVEFNPGVRLSIGSGFRFNEWFSAGAEMGFTVNGFKDADGTFSQAPFLGNVELRLPNKSRIVPFIGGGPGMTFSSIYLDDDNLGNGSRVDGGTSDVVFAWQAYGGLRFKINEYTSAGIIYKYFDAQAPEWDVDDTSQDIRFGKTHIHAISACVMMSF
jgi:opacity protein-like surface antigen